MSYSCKVWFLVIKVFLCGGCMKNGDFIFYKWVFMVLFNEILFWYFWVLVIMSIFFWGFGKFLKDVICNNGKNFF